MIASAVRNLLFSDLKSALKETLIFRFKAKDKEPFQVSIDLCKGMNTTVFGFVED